MTQDNQTPERRLTRRELLTRAGQASLGVAAAGLLGPLAACSPVAPQAESKPAASGAAPAAGEKPQAPAVIKGQTFAIAIWGGPFSQVIREHIQADFEKDHGVKLVMEEGVTSDALAKVRGAGGNPQHTVVGIDDQFIPELKSEGMLVQLTPQDVPNLKDVYAEYIMEEGFGVGCASSWMSPAYNTEAIKPDPETWAAMWDPKYKGRVVMLALTAGTAWMQLAAAAAVKTGKPIKEAQYDMDAGFAALKELKPNVHSITGSTLKYAPMLAQGEIWILPTPSRIAFPYKVKGAPIDRMKVKEGSFVLLNCVGLVNKAPLQEQGKDFINRFIAAKVQVEMAKGALTGPVNKNSEIPADLQGLVPGKDDVSQLIALDWGHVIKNRKTYLDRFNTEIAS